MAPSVLFDPFLFDLARTNNIVHESIFSKTTKGNLNVGYLILLLPTILSDLYNEHVRRECRL